jgi:hypothetical protein
VTQTVTKRTPTVRLVEIAELLGVSKQSAHQLTAGDGFPPAVGSDDRGHCWDGRQVAAWART